jgi:hypothetical protein
MGDRTVRRWIADRTKAALDRRYTKTADGEALSARVDELSERLVPMERLALLGAVFVADEDPNDLREKLLAAHRSTIESATLVASLSESARLGSSFVSNEDPHELRKKLFAAFRLATESAIGIESLLQSEILLWQALDAVSEADSSGVEGGGVGVDVAAP